MWHFQSYGLDHPQNMYLHCLQASRCRLYQMYTLEEFSVVPSLLSLNLFVVVPC